MSASLLHPTGRVGVSDEVKKAAEKSQPVTSAKTESGGMRRQGVRKRAGVVKDGAYPVCDDPGDSVGVLFVIEQVGSDT